VTLLGCPHIASAAERAAPDAAPAAHRIGVAPNGRGFSVERLTASDARAWFFVPGPVPFVGHTGTVLQAAAPAAPIDRIRGVAERLSERL